MSEPVIGSQERASDGLTTAPRPLWRNRDYMLLWSGQLVSTLGTGVSQLAFPLLMLALTRSPAQAGLLGAVEALPYIIFSLPAGALVDRWNRKRVMVICDTGRAVSMASIPVVAVFWHLEVACLPRVVPREQLPNATAQNEGGAIAAYLIAPSLGGFLYQSIGKSIPFLVDAVSYAASVVSLLFIRTAFQEERTAPPRALWVEITEGLRWLWNQPLIRFMAFLTGGLNFGNAGVGLILIVLAQHQHAAPATVGIIFSVGSVGGILGSILAPRIQKRYRFGQVIISMVWIEALLWPLFAIAPSPLLLGVIAAGQWITGPIYNAVQFSYRLALIPDALQGRVNSAFRLLSVGFQPLGAALSGVMLQSIGAPFTVLVFSACTAALALLATVNAHVRNARPIAAAHAG
jgi:predicted MFS family arabinose efflux permease